MNNIYSLIMRVGTVVAIFVSFVPFVHSFAPMMMKMEKNSNTQLNAVSRREAVRTSVIGLISGSLIAPKESIAFSQQLDDYMVEPTQLPTNGKTDLNSAYVSDYMQFRGMYPTAAGKIASNGPYYKVKDIYEIPGITANDVSLFKAYENEFTVNPPGRQFKERINARVST